MDSLSAFCVLHCLVLVLALLTQALGERSRKKERPQPRFLESQVNYTYEEGELARLECILEGLGTKNVIWRKSSEPNPLTIGKKRYVDDTRVMVEHTPLGKDWHLLIKQVRLDDEGQYECQVASKDKTLRRYVSLTVKPGEKVSTGIPEIHIEGDTYVNKKSTIRLVCNATGEEHPPDDIDWFLNGQKLVSDFAYQISIEKRMSLTEKTIYSILEIRNAKMKDAGIYVCRTSDLQIASARVDVLNADTNNVKRDGVNTYSPGEGHTTLGRGRLPGSGSCRLSSGTSLLLALLLCLAIHTLPSLLQWGAEQRQCWFVT